MTLKSPPFLLAGAATRVLPRVLQTTVLSISSNNALPGEKPPWGPWKSTGDSHGDRESSQGEHRRIAGVRREDLREACQFRNRGLAETKRWRGTITYLALLLATGFLQHEEQEKKEELVIGLSSS